MKFILLPALVLSLYSGASRSDDDGVEVKNIGEMLAQITLEKKQMESIVDKLVVSGRISPDNAVRAKREIASVKEEDVEQVKMHMVAVINSRQKN